MTEDSRNKEKHPSFYRLDQFAALQRVERKDDTKEFAQLEAHVRTCEQCSGYIRELGAPGFVPPWVKEIKHGSLASSSQGPASLWRVLFPALATFAVAAAALVFVLVPEGSSGPGGGASDGAGAEVMEKGSSARDSGPLILKKGGIPDALVHVRRDGQVFVFDSEHRLQAGDAIRISVTPARYAFVSVLAPSEDAGARTFDILHRSQRLRGRTELSPAWEVDGVGDEERLLLVFSKKRMSAEALRKAAIRREKSMSTWVKVMRLRK